MGSIKLGNVDLTAAANPAAGKTTLALDLDGKLKTKTSDGTITPVSNDVIVTDVTYMELRALMSAGTLVPSAHYRITDYRTKNFLHGAYLAYNEGFTDVHTASIEPLIVRAATASTIYHQAFSEAFPHDEIHYDVNRQVIGIVTDYTNNGSAVQVVGDRRVITLDADLYVDEYLYVYVGFNNGDYIDAEWTAIPSFTLTESLLYNESTIALDLVISGSEISVGNIPVGATINSVYISYMRAESLTTGRIVRRTDVDKNVSYPGDFRGMRYRRYIVNLTSLNIGLGTVKCSTRPTYIVPMTGETKSSTGSIDLPVFDMNRRDIKNINIVGHDSVDFDGNFVALAVIYNVELYSVRDVTILSTCSNVKAYTMSDFVINYMSFSTVEFAVNSLHREILSGTFGNLSSNVANSMVFVKGGMYFTGNYITGVVQNLSVQDSCSDNTIAGFLTLCELQSLTTTTITASGVVTYLKGITLTGCTVNDEFATCTFDQLSGCILGLTRNTQFHGFVSALDLTSIDMANGNKRIFARNVAESPIYLLEYYNSSNALVVEQLN